MNKIDKNKKLIIWEVCNSVDERDINFYDNLSDEQKKSLTMYPLLRWVSSVDSRNVFMLEYYIQMSNEVNEHFWELQKYPDLIWKMLANCGVGSKQKHKWIPKSKNISKTPKIDELLFILYPEANYEEIGIVRNKLNKEKFETLMSEFGIQKSEIKKYREEYKKLGI